MNRSLNYQFNIDEIAQDEIMNMLQDDTISEDQLTSAAWTASHESEQEIEAKPEQRTEAKPEKEQIRKLEITEPTVSRATSTTRSLESGEDGGFTHPLHQEYPEHTREKLVPFYLQQ